MVELNPRMGAARDLDANLGNRPATDAICGQSAAAGGPLGVRIRVGRRLNDARFGSLGVGRYDGYATPHPRCPVSPRPPSVAVPT